MIILIVLVFAVLSEGVVWPPPDSLYRPIYHVGGLSNEPGYIGDGPSSVFFFDVIRSRHKFFSYHYTLNYRTLSLNSLSTTSANGMMFRQGLFHLAWQCTRSNTSGLMWCHSVSKDFVTWKGDMPPMIERGGAESGGVAQLENGDIVAIFNQVGGAGHWQARPSNLSDIYLTHWTDRNPNGTTCATNCIPTPGIPGTDLSQAFQDGSRDGYWRVVADRPDSGGAEGAAMLVKTKDFLSFQEETNASVFHQYSWKRCETLPSLCGFGPYPRDPNVALIPGTSVSVFYGMQKTCSFTGRQFYSLGTYDLETKRFTLLNNRSDYANNLFDGGEGYAGQHVYDPIQDRLIYVQAVIEGDRDPCGNATGEGFWQNWMVQRKIGRGYFGTLSLPRVIHLWNISQYFQKETVFIRTEPLPELSKLRDVMNETKFVNLTINKKGNDLKLQSGRHVELDLRVDRRSLGSSFDFGAHVLMSSDMKEYTSVGIRDATWLEDVDLWDEVNSDTIVVVHAENASECQTLCSCSRYDDICTAWTFSMLSKNCTIRRYAEHALMMVSSNGAFQPYREGCISGFRQDLSSKIFFAQLYVNRTYTHLQDVSSSSSEEEEDIPYPSYSYAKTLILEPTESEIRLQVFVDGTIIEAFANNGTSVVTGRVYPRLSDSNHVQLFTLYDHVHISQLDSYILKSALQDQNDEFLDSRNVFNTRTVLSAGYTDQPYCTKSSSSRLSCVVTISNAGEGSFGEHVVSIFSDDFGVTWSGPHTIELPDGVKNGLPNAYAIVVRSLEKPKHQDFSRIFAIYNLNSMNISKPIVSGRNDELGFFFVRYSDDGGLTWSQDRWLVPYPDTWIDLHNTFRSSKNMTTRIMWTVDHVKIRNKTAYFAFTKIGTYVQNPPEEIFVISSSDLLGPLGMENDLSKVSWSMLPENEDHGVRCPRDTNPNTTVMEEGHILPLESSQNMVVMARTSLGYLAISTRDVRFRRIDDDDFSGIAMYWNNSVVNGTLVPLHDVEIAPNVVARSGMKHPRGPFSPKRVSKKHFLMLYYNNKNGGSFGRDPYWLSCGIEVNDTILWSQPEIVLYDRSFHGGTSGGGYPDILFENFETDQSELSNIPPENDVFIIASQKGMPQPSRVFLSKVNETLLQDLYAQSIASNPPPFRSVLSAIGGGENETLQALPSSGTGSEISQQGFTISVMLNGGVSHPNTPILESEHMYLDRSIFRFDDQKGHHFSQSIDSVCAAVLSTNRVHHLTVVADSGPGILFFVVDGTLCDMSWSWIVNGMGSIPKTNNLFIGSDVKRLDIYANALRTSQVVSLYRYLMFD